jgi:Flp pilus assembly protein TadG
MIMFTIIFIIFIGLLFVADLEEVKNDKKKLK